MRPATPAVRLVGLAAALAAALLVTPAGVEAQARGPAHVAVAGIGGGGQFGVDWRVVRWSALGLGVTLGGTIGVYEPTALLGVQQASELGFSGERRLTTSLRAGLQYPRACTRSGPCLYSFAAASLSYFAGESASGDIAAQGGSPATSRWSPGAELGAGLAPFSGAFRPFVELRLAAFHFSGAGIQGPRPFVAAGLFWTAP